MNHPLVLVATALIAAAGLILSYSAHRRLTSARRSLAMLQGSFEGKTLLDAVSSYATQMKSLEDDLAALAHRQEELFGLLGRSKRNLGVVRYDAFEDMGGRLSFSSALLDDHGSGVVITSIYGRTESRVYAKEVTGGSSEHNLSKEEQQAISDSLGLAQKARR